MVQNLRPDLRKALVVLLIKLSCSTATWQWGIIGRDENGLFNLLGYQSYQLYWDFILSCDSTSSMINVK